MKKILFIGHDAFRAGAQISLLHILRSFKKTCEINFSIILKNGGVLENEYKNILDTYVWNSEDRTKILELIKQENFDIIFANTCASCEVLIEIKKHTKAKVILMIHELEFSIRKYCGLETFGQCKNLVDQYITVSEATKQNLIENHDIPDSKISLIYEGIPSVDYQKLSLSTNIRHSLGLYADDFVVVGCGTSDYRKGYDIFIQLANLTNQISESPIYFIWVGSLMENSEKISRDINNLGLEKLVFFVGEETNVSDYMLSSDIFALTSREDPFPLVCLEASSFGKPEALMPLICRYVANWPYYEFILHGNNYNTPDGSCIRDFIDINDLARVHVMCLDWLKDKTGVFEIFNVGTGRGISVKTILETFKSVNKIDSYIFTEKDYKFIVGPKRDGDVEQIWADTSKIEKVLGYKTQYTLEQSCRNAYNAFFS